jgi:hypothetical protein
LVKIGPAHYSAAVLSPTSSPDQRLTDLTDAMIYGFTVPHLLIPAAASVVFLFPPWGILFPGAYTLANLLPFISLGWLLIGAIAAGILRVRRPAAFQALGKAVAPNLDKQLEPD